MLAKSFPRARRRSSPSPTAAALVSVAYRVHDVPGLPNPSPRRLVAKAILDRIGAAVVLSVATPLLAVTALAILVTEGRPVLFSQERVGRHGHRFAMWKFRTMQHNAETALPSLRVHHERRGGLFKLRHDPRVTRLGGWLRRYSIDELPQLWNVLRGEMSLVGPRPTLPHEQEQFPEKARQRLVVLPGMTGAWQISGRSELSMDEAVQLDLDYVENWSVAGDLLIIWKTIGAVLRGTGAY